MHADGGQARPAVHMSAKAKKKKKKRPKKCRYQFLALEDDLHHKPRSKEPLNSCSIIIEWSF